LQSVLRLNVELEITVRHRGRRSATGVRNLLFSNANSSVSPVNGTVDDFALHLFERGARAAEVEPDRRNRCGKRRRKTKRNLKPDRLHCAVKSSKAASREVHCPCCQDEMPDHAGTDIAERLDLIPAELFLLGDPSFLETCLRASAKKKSPRFRWVKNLAV